jgi:hypothetical protein
MGIAHNVRINAELGKETGRVPRRNTKKDEDLPEGQQMMRHQQLWDENRTGRMVAEELATMTICKGAKEMPKKHKPNQKN